MKLSLKDELVISAALGAVRSAAGNLLNAHDTEAAKRALRALNVEVIDALELINRAEFEARLAALAPYHKEPA